MCGFAGFFGFKNNFPTKEERLNLLKKMSDPISRRGPDDEQFFDDGTMSFAFRRLSIVDLQAGRQPIWNEDDSIFVSINGEIYNHRDLRASLKGQHKFRTQSDTEIVLHLYEEMGPKCLDLLIGMFAVVIYDKVKKEVFFARDRMGIKPLYLCKLKDGFLFGSELKALLAFPQCPREPDLKPFYLGDSSAGGLSGKRVSTYIKGIEFLPGGSYAFLNQRDGLVEKKYWNIENYFTGEESEIKSPQFYVDEYARLIEDSVEKRLMSDVPIGSFLSGGLDSALVTAIAAQKNKDLHCFHALEKTTFSCGDTAAARQLSKNLGIPFHPVLFNNNVLLKNMKFSLKDFEYFVWIMDSPRFDLEWFFKHELHRYAKTKVPNIKVMLLGQGSDEFACGYSNTNGLVEDWESYTKLGLKREAQAQIFEDEGIPMERRGLMSENFSLTSDTPLSHFRKMAMGRCGRLQGYNLWHEDRTSSAQGVESRVPFLDHRLVEFLVSIPSKLHAELFWDKKIVRRAAEKWISPELAHRPKIGFYQTRNQDSIWDLKRSLVKKIFPEYKEKYLNSGKTYFSVDTIESVFSAAIVEDQSSWGFIEILLRCISHDSFNEICKAQDRGYLSALTTPSPFSEAKDGEPEKIWNINEWNLEKSSWKKSPRRWKDTDCPMMADGVTVIFHLPYSLHFSANGSEAVAIDLTPKTEWFLELVRFLVSEDYKPLDFKKLEKKFKTRRSSIKSIVRTLAEMDLVTAYQDTEFVKKAA